MAGIGARLRVARNTYLFVEGSPDSPATTGRDAGQLRLRAARRRTRVPVELLQRLRHHARAGGARRHGDRGLVPGLQSLEEILLMTKTIWQGLAPPCWWPRRPRRAAAESSPTAQRRRRQTPPTTAHRQRTRPTATITIGSDGSVSPSTVTITRGGRVTFVNNHTRPTTCHPTRIQNTPIALRSAVGS